MYLSGIYFPSYSLNAVLYLSFKHLLALMKNTDYEAYCKGTCPCMTKSVGSAELTSSSSRTPRISLGKVAFLLVSC